MEFTDRELEQIKYALEYLHDADLSDLYNEDIRDMESAMTKLGMRFDSQLPEETEKRAIIDSFELRDRKKYFETEITYCYNYSLRGYTCLLCESRHKCDRNWLKQ